jgi:hypothetical protein
VGQLKKILAAALALLLFPSLVAAQDRLDGTASWYGPGNGVATQWCTWTLRHTQGCGMLAIQSHQTGLVVIAPVVDWCQCYRDTPQERIVDLQWGVVAALGLDKSQGLYPVTTWSVSGSGLPEQNIGLPDAAMDPFYSDQEMLTIIGWLLLCLSALLLLDKMFVGGKK